MYLLAITVGLCAAYFGLMFLFSMIFTNKFPVIPQKRSVFSVIVIALLSIVGYVISFSIPDPNLSNRFLRGFGGGFLAFLVCFLAVRDARIPVSRFQFFVFSFLVVTTLGVANEIAEFFLQTVTGIVYTPTITDTWLDLSSNTVGIMIAAACFTPFIKKE